ncbi:hypothetical protein EYF80_028497 [Liparis tanakae]|uniref:Uncharacterized protein n=1 Tax=Liparis tanakae TaxID=230148 RepID=A0A4Z2H8U7_9TELE|nr:hypothetical protein EYF80_028497 [Liparis tanakae]
MATDKPTHKVPVEIPYLDIGNAKNGKASSSMQTTAKNKGINEKPCASGGQKQRQQQESDGLVLGVVSLVWRPDRVTDGDLEGELALTQRQTMGDLSSGRFDVEACKRYGSPGAQRGSGAGPYSAAVENTDMQDGVRGDRRPRLLLPPEGEKDMGGPAVWTEPGGTTSLLPDPGCSGQGGTGGARPPILNRGPPDEKKTSVRSYTYERK